MPIPLTIIELLKSNSGNSRQAAIFEPGKTEISYVELFDFISNIILQLNQRGFNPKDRIALVLPNGAMTATAFLAISSVCTCAPINPAYHQDDFEFYLSDMNASALATVFEHEHACCQAAEKLGIPIIRIIPDEQTSGIFRLDHHIPIQDIINEPAMTELDDIALVLHTSGTTSRPKKVALTHRNLFHSIQNIIITYNLAPDDRCLNMMPLFHIHGLVGAVLASLASGGSVVCTPGFDAELVSKWLDELQPTWFTAVPTILHALFEECHKTFPDNKPHLRFIRSCSSPLPAQLGVALEMEFNAPVLEAYGMTEAAHQISSNPLPPLPHKFGSVGKSTGTTSVAIFDESGEMLPAGMDGEICIRGENVITEYESNPVANKSGFVNGWLRTGDRGFIDPDGYIFIQGRNKELINRAGEKISPREIEEVLLEHPLVKEAVVFPVEHPSLGEDVAAAVVLKEGRQASMQELRQFAAEKLVDFKVPRLIIFIDRIPKGPTGKVIRIGLAGKLNKEIELARNSYIMDETRPRDNIEKELVVIWQEILNTKPIGIREDFLALGGDSLMAVRILMQVEKRLSARLSLRELFNTPTIEDMAQYIKRTRN